ETIPEETELETFVHGAMCISYSGRCLLSNFLNGRDANRGECTHPCRWKYFLMEETRPGEYYPVEENERGTYLFNSRDLCMIGHIPELIEAGIDSFKIEGRMKTALYVATVARAYRMAIDDWFESPKRYRERIPFYLEEVAKCTHRQFTTGFYFSKPDENSQIYDHNTYVTEYTYLGMVEETDPDGSILIHQRNKFETGDEIEIIRPDGENVPATVIKITDEEGAEQESAPHPKQELHVLLSSEVLPEQGDLLRMRTKDPEQTAQKG
ncbi:MAG: U32 family peptidase C-terminal domain-containing protein, partial [Lachnospiraceae bacterium]|nr:U32 family peptidase C-terminal domain-containing protein [Lachnospiraceae bacterium]